MADRNMAIAPLDTGGWDLMVRQADILIKSRFLPASIDTPEKAITIMMTGAELGVPRMQALRQIYVVGGKPTCMAELMAAMIYRDQGDDALIPVKSTPEIATYRFKRRTWPAHQEFSFTIQQAETAGLLDGKNAHNWKKYPDAMLRARCISAVARMAFPDTIGGMYTPEELDATVQVNPDGTMEITEHQERQQRKQPPTQYLSQAPENDDEPPAIEVTARTTEDINARADAFLVSKKPDHYKLTPEQHREIVRLRDALGIDRDEFEAGVQKAYVGRPTAGLTMTQADDLIAKLTKRLATKPAPPPEPEPADEPYDDLPDF